MKLPQLGTPVTLYCITRQHKRLMSILPNKEPGRALAYLGFISPRWHIGPCIRGTIMIQRREVDG